MSQFFQIHPENPQARLIRQAIEIIHQGGVVIYPTDSGYAIGCCIGNKKSMERIKKIRGLEKHHNFTLMCRDLSELANYARVDNQLFRVIKNNTPGLYTFIFKGTKEVPKRLLNDKKKTIGIRVPQCEITLALLEELAEPLMSCSLILPGQEHTESDPEEIRNKLEKHVDLIIHGGFLSEQPTSVIDFSEGEVNIIREGSGDVSVFE
ncbi:threonylcarbamoyl-AMP synthase [Pseudoalteromonas sp. NBT06-2]|uniref:L-threonylcarbamoyladenylate synthase n=1 Tax=Pseudoalteromonas sp. NBT06-2 TaxID=2025950 RepID=UPI000BA57E3B|nr:L-threonylcarbamoyladenylate synthase [Pseudoalteromonas sp. NBT06-2]PAJ73936.1 threonylcarbamoyl-AMP synthase [Pseudoalteromonas sp. NBT06-2]